MGGFNFTEKHVQIVRVSALSKYLQLNGECKQENTVLCKRWNTEVPSSMNIITQQETGRNAITSNIQTINPNTGNPNFFSNHLLANRHILLLASYDSFQSSLEFTPT
jgi:hypothetical protein